jgi:dienelactone hydrolase
MQASAHLCQEAKLKIEMESVGYHDGDTTLSGMFVTDADRTEPRPGVLVVHGGAGLDEHAKGRARRMAALGYVAFACDMYGVGVPGNRERIVQTIGALRAEPGRLARRASAGLDVLLRHPQVDGRIGAIGYCFGGLSVLELARSGRALAGVVSVHGTLEASARATPGSIYTTILVLHGSLDPHVPTAQVTGFADEMRDAGADWYLIVYGGAQHGFTHETADGARTPGVAYHALADERSSRAIADFFSEVFGAASQQAAAPPLR